MRRREPRRPETPAIPLPADMPIFHDLATVIFPLACCIAFTVAVEQVLYRRDMIYMPLWRPAVMSVILGISAIIWNSWMKMIPMESVLMYGGRDASSLATSVALFVIVVWAALVALAWTSVQRMMVDRNRGASTFGILLLRLSTLVPPFLMAIVLLVRSNNMVGEKGFLSLVLD